MSRRLGVHDRRNPTQGRKPHPTSTTRCSGAIIMLLRCRSGVLLSPYHASPLALGKTRFPGDDNRCSLWCLSVVLGWRSGHPPVDEVRRTHTHHRTRQRRSHRGDLACTRLVPIVISLIHPYYASC